MIYDSLAELIGHTPVLEVKNIEKSLGLQARILVKIESFNPGGSVKDRVALAMIEDAERSGLIGPGATIIEPTSGNTGIGLAWIGATRGYRVILTMPETMSMERRRILAAYGAEIVLTPGAEGMNGAIRKANELQASIPGSFIPGQFDNPANPAVHYRTTAREILNDTEGKVDIFIAGVGTGGTLSGIGKALKEHKPEVTVIAVEPSDSPVLQGGKPGAHKIQGIGAGFVPQNFDKEVVDRVEGISTDEAFAAARMLASSEGILSGISSGAAMAAALKEARNPANAGKTILAILPDTGERYLSTPLYE